MIYTSNTYFTICSSPVMLLYHCLFFNKKIFNKKCEGTKPFPFMEKAGFNPRSCSDLLTKTVKNSRKDNNNGKYY